MLGLRRLQRGAPGIRSGQSGAGFACSGEVGFGGGQLLGEVFGRLRQFLEPRGQPFLRRFGLIEAAQGMTFGLDSACDCTLLCNQFGLERREFLARGTLLAFGSFRRAAQIGQHAFKLRQPVRSFQFGSFSRSFAASDKTVPAAQMSAGCNQPFAGAKRAAIIFVGAMHQRKAGAQFVRAVGDVIEQAARDRFGCAAACPKPAISRRGRCAER